jgi:hypothetical protein
MIRSLSLSSLVLALPLSFSLVACSATVSPSPEPTSSSGSASNTGSPNGSQTVLAFSCDGRAVARSYELDLDLDVSPRCGNGTETDCGGNKASACAAQDVTFSYPPPAVDCDHGVQVFSWDGSTCVGHKVVGGDGNLLCKGSDCAKLFQTEQACRTAYASCL